MSPLLNMAFKNLWRHPWRTFATTIGVAIGIAAVLATLSIGRNVHANVSLMLERTAGKADLLVTPGAQGRAVLKPAEILDTIRQTPGVATALPVLNWRAEPVRAITINTGSVVPGVDSGFQLSGRLTEHPDLLTLHVLEGNLPTENSQGVAISDVFARERDIAIGDTLHFASRFGALPFIVSGILDSSVGFAATNGGRIGVAHLSDVQAAFRLTQSATFIQVFLKPEATQSEVQTLLTDRLDSRFTVTLPANSGNVALGIVDTIQAGLLVLSVTLLALGAFMAYNTFSASVVERVREYALLRTICLSRRQVARLALIESLFISVLGIILGILLGVLLAWGITWLNAVALGYEVSALVIPIPHVLIAAALGMVCALFAGFIPARTASLTRPIQASRTSDETTLTPHPHIGWAFLAAGVLVAFGPWVGYQAVAAAAIAMLFLFVGVMFVAPVLLGPTWALLRPLLMACFGTAGKLGGSFTLRNSVRNGVAIAAVVVGIGITLGVGGMVAGINHAIQSWVNTTIVGDMFITTPASFPEDFEARAYREAEGLEVLSGVGVRIVRYQPPPDPTGERVRGRSVALILVDPERFEPKEGFGRFQYIQGQGDDRSGYEALTAGGQLLAANTMFDRFGLAKGSIANVRTSEGPRDFPIAAVVVDFTGGGEALVGSIHDVELWGGGTPDLYIATVKAGTDAEAVGNQLKIAFPELHLDITPRQAYQERVLTLTRQTFFTTNALLLLAVIISALGVTNTLGMNLSRRQREIAVLRTLGLTRGGIHRVISSEGVIILVLGTLLGVVCGVLLSQVITKGAMALTGFRIEPTYPWRLVLIAVLGSPLLGLVASHIPARRAAQLSPVQALGQAE